MKPILSSNITNNNNEVMSLTNYFYSLSDSSPKQNLTKQIMTECRVSYVTAYRWLRGITPIPPASRKIIANITGVSEDKLFGVPKTD